MLRPAGAGSDALCDGLAVLLPWQWQQEGGLEQRGGAGAKTGPLTDQAAFAGLGMIVDGSILFAAATNAPAELWVGLISAGADGQ